MWNEEQNEILHYSSFDELFEVNVPKPVHSEDIHEQGMYNT